MRTRPAMMIVKIVSTLQMTKTILARFVTDTLNELILIIITKNYMTNTSDRGNQSTHARRKQLIISLVLQVVHNLALCSQVEKPFFTGDLLAAHDAR